MKKTVLILSFLFCLISGALILEPMDANAANTTLAALQAKFPHGKYWNSGNANTYTSSPCSHHTPSNAPNCDKYGSCGCTFYNGIQCNGFARKVTDEYYGSQFKTWSTTSTTSSIKAGDVIYYSGHYAWITSRSGNTLTLGECNWYSACQIYWGRQISISSLPSGALVYVAPYELTSTSYVDLGTDFYATINHVTNNYAVSYDETGNLQLAENAVNEKTRWHFIRQTDGSYMMYMDVGSQCMDVYWGGTTDGTRVGLSNANYGNAQKWYIYEEAGAYIFKTLSSHMVLDVSTNHGLIGDLLQVWTPNQSDAQHFKINKVKPFNDWVYIHNDSKTTPFYSDQDVIFTYDAVYSGYYDLWLYEDGVKIGQLYAGKEKTYRKRYEAGNYELLFASQNEVGWNWGRFHPFTVIDRYYNITFDSNGGTCSVANKTVEHNKAYGDCPVPVKDGYTFKGWFTEATGGTQITSDTIVTTTEPQTLYAQWTANDYTVSYDMNGGAGTVPSGTYSYGTKAVITDFAPLRDGYVFAGWATSADAAAAEYLANDEYTAYTDITLYAVWKPVPSISAELTAYSSYSMCSVSLSNVDTDCIIVFAKYKGDSLVSTEIRDYAGNEEMYPIFEDVDAVKIMVMDSKSHLMPICKNKTIQID